MISTHNIIQVQCSMGLAISHEIFPDISHVQYEEYYCIGN